LSCSASIGVVPKRNNYTVRERGVCRCHKQGE
jgi:hypothetical protein